MYPVVIVSAPGSYEMEHQQLSVIMPFRYTVLPRLELQEYSVLKDSLLKDFRSKSLRDKLKSLSDKLT